MAASAVDAKLSVINETRKRPKLVPVDQLKGRPPLRARPIDFEIIFTEIGRVDCETYYRAARVTIDRWLEECGKERLLKARRDFVAHQRKLHGPLRAGVRLGDVKKPEKPKVVKPARDRRKVSPCVVRHVAHWLRMRCNGGFMTSPTGKGDWWLGTKRVTPAQILDLAVARGFDRMAASITCSMTENLDQKR